LHPIRMISFGYLHLPTGPDGSPPFPPCDRLPASGKRSKIRCTGPRNRSDHAIRSESPCLGWAFRTVMIWRKSLAAPRSKRGLGRRASTEAICRARPGHCCCQASWAMSRTAAVMASRLAGRWPWSRATTGRARSVSASLSASPNWIANALARDSVAASYRRPYNWTTPRPARLHG